MRPSWWDKAPNLALRTGGIVLVTAIVAWYAVELGRESGFSGTAYLVWAWFASLGWVVLALHLLGHPSLGERYHRLRAFETEGLYHALGVSHFGKLMVNGLYANRIMRAWPLGFRVVRGRSDLGRWEATTRSKEAGHAWHLMIGGLLAAYAVGAEQYEAAGWLFLLTVAFDLYPVLLQRYNRVRASRTARGRRRAGQDQPPGGV